MPSSSTTSVTHYSDISLFILQSMAQTLLYLIVIFIVAEFLFAKVLSYLNIRSWDKPVPDEVKELYQDGKFEKAKAYALDNNRVETISSTLSFVITLTFL